MRIEPAPSVALATPTRPAATAAAEPPLERRVRDKVSRITGHPGQRLAV